MALPTTYYEATELSETVIVTRVDGGYIFSINDGVNITTNFVSEGEINQPNFNQETEIYRLLRAQINEIEITNKLLKKILS